MVERLQKGQMPLRPLSASKKTEEEKTKRSNLEKTNTLRSNVVFKTFGLKKLTQFQKYKSIRPKDSQERSKSPLTERPTDFACGVPTVIIFCFLNNNG